MSEYSYFRAENRSYDAVQRAVEANEKIKELSRKLAERYGAMQFVFWPGKEDRKETCHFLYTSRDKVPENFVVDSVQKDSVGKEMYLFASPKPFTPDAFNIAAVKGLIASAEKSRRLEDIFGCGEMPERDLSAGKYSRSFVRDRTLVAEWNGFGFIVEPKVQKGHMTDRVTMCGASNSPVTGSDPLDYAKLNENWYIRVPNDKDGNPVFVPPDAVPMAFSDMLEADAQEWDLLRGLKPSAQKPSGP